MRRMLLVFGAVALSASIAAQDQHDHSGTPGEKLGTVHFPTSCSAAAQVSFDRAVALLHSFEFGPAIEAFDEFDIVVRNVGRGENLAHRFGSRW